VSSPWFPQSRTPPGLYRLARAFRRISLIVLVVVLLFLASAAYSAVEVVRSGPTAGNFSAAFSSNGTVAVSGDLNFSNNGFYPISDFSVHIRVLNQSQVYLGTGSFGPVTLSSGAVQPIMVTFDLPVGTSGPGASLLTQDQVLNVSVWGNATYAYLIPVSIAVETNRSWGAPFANLEISVGTPFPGGGGFEVPVTIQFQNHAKFDESGVLQFSVVSANGPSCGGSSFSVSVPAGSAFDQSKNVPISAGCSPAGGTLNAQYIANGLTIPLPPEAIP
jgi:hypothetical protein